MEVDQGGASHVLALWWNGLDPYMKSTDLRWCPSEPDRNDQHLPSSYLMNGLITAGARSLADIEAPAGTVLMAERARNWANLPDNDPNDPYSPYYDLCYDSWLPNGNWSAGIAAWPPLYGDLLDLERHTGGANYGFCDGHAKWLKWPDTVRSADDNLHDLH